MKLLRKIAIAIIATVVGFAHADTSSSFQSPFAFELERTTLAEIRSTLGEATEFDIPESHHEFGICYESEEAEEIFIFVSGHEFGGSEKRLLGVTIVSNNSMFFPCAP